MGIIEGLHLPRDLHDGITNCIQSMEAAGSGENLAFNDAGAITDGDELHNLLELNEEIKDMRYAHPLDDVERTYGIYSETKPSFKVPPGSALKVQMEFFPNPGEEGAKKATVNLTVLFLRVASD